MEGNMENGISRDVFLWSYCRALKKVQDKGNGTAIDANEKVDAWQRDIGCAGDTEYEGHGVHHWCHRPPMGKKEMSINWAKTNKQKKVIMTLKYSFLW